jgi:L-cysteine/cystine lyase
VDAAALRSEFPVCAEKAFFNAGTCGPLPTAALQAAARYAEHALAEGRAHGYYEEFFAVRERLRAGYAGVIGARPEDVAVTTSSSEGMVRVLLGLGLERGDEVLIAELEHPGLLGPLAGLRAQRGIEVREVPLAQIADAVSPATRLVACSHVSWTTGELAPALDAVRADVPVLVDGAQGAGAIPVDVTALGCAFYAGSGQKWLCGPVATGLLWVAPRWREQLLPVMPTYVNLVDPALGVEARPWPDARAHDAISMALETAAAAEAALGVLRRHGLDAIHERARELAADVAQRLAAAGRDVAPRAETTLVSWLSPDPEAEAARLAEAGVVVRSFPGLPYVRASVGAWNDESDVERLLAAAATSPG